MSTAKRRRVPAIRVDQWLRSWNKVQFDEAKHRSKPTPYFFVFALPAAELRSLCGIFRRQVTKVGPRSADLGIQREHDPDRSEEIQRYVEYGYPWSTLSKSKRESGKYEDLRKPGWLPTAIVLNVLTKGEKREGRPLADRDVVTVESKLDRYEVVLPYEKWSMAWSPTETPPFEVIDGQHRLWAFESHHTDTANFEVPIVCFQGLDISWQAYLFYTINIKPKRINPSLAFDLYPLLRAEDWLERAEEHIVYRDTRSQELTETLWSYPDSPWYDRINMLGERGTREVTQNAWIRGLSSSFVRPWDSRGGRVGGLFGERLGKEGEVLRWSRAQQAAFLVYAWQQLRENINQSNSDWVKALRFPKGSERKNRFDPSDEPGFYSPQSLISTDQGIRGFLLALNDICYTLASKLKLNDWHLKPSSGPIQDAAITAALKSLSAQPVAKTVRSIAAGLSSFDWRTSTAERLDESQRQLKLTFRGSGGYRELRRQLLKHLSEHGEGIKDAAARLLGYD